MDEIDTTPFMKVCVLTKSRRAARAVSRHFGRLLEAHGLTPSQASLMFMLSASRTKSVSALAEVMGIERSALTRNLQLLESAGYVKCEIGGRGGAKAYRLSARGCEKVIELGPLWHEGQSTLRKKLGELQWDRMQDALAALAEI